MDERGESIKIFLRNAFLFHSAENFLRVESLSVSIVLSIETILDKGGDGSIKIFCRVFFRFTVPKTLLIEPLCAAFQNFSGIKQIWIRKRGGRIKGFCRKNFVSRGRKILT